MPSSLPYRLKVRRIERTCVFELTWGKGQELCAELAYPETLTPFYENWQQAYLNFYKSALRARVEHSGTIATPQIDWRAQLVQAEAKLLSEFHYWLSSAELLEIRAEIAKAATDKAGDDTSPVNVFLTCEPLEMARFPWEAWEIRTEFAVTKSIRIARTPANIRAESRGRSRQGKVRILAIVGDETGLNFQADREAIQSLDRIAEVQFVGWQPGQNEVDLKTQICQAIVDEQGWDVLFFAGHSNETDLTGGELVIAPNQSILLQEIAPQLTLAKARGLQFAIFNSCNGLTIAQTLINLGLSQVAVMREPIHNQVAQEFLIRFLQNLAEFKDVHDAMLLACQFLKLERNLTYPSAYLIPSLFRHPDSTLFQIEPPSWRKQLQQWQPTPREAIALAGLLFLSLYSPTQSFLMERRVLMQAVYRDVTGQLPKDTQPAVLLVQIDEKSIRRAGISSPNPMNRRYLASLIDRAAAMGAKVIGLDYLLDRPQPGNDPIIARSVRRAVADHQTWFVFGAVKDSEESEIGVGEETGITSPTWSLQGYTNTPLWYLALPPDRPCQQICPFTYLIAVAHTLAQSAYAPQPQLSPAPNCKLKDSGNCKGITPLPKAWENSNPKDFRTEIVNYLNQQRNAGDAIAFLKSLHLNSVTQFSISFDQRWLQPLIDFSIPPESAYTPIAAWQFLDKTNSLQLNNAVVLIGAGGYEEAGTTAGTDNFPMPPAIEYWRSRNSSAPQLEEFTGAEANAYKVHLLLTRRLVIPVPDLWMVGLAVLLGKGASVLFQRHRWRPALAGGTVAYGLISLQAYISSSVLLPWLLPTMAVCIYLLPSQKKTHV